MFLVHNRKSVAQAFVSPSGKRLELQVGINKVSDELMALFRNKIEYDPMLSIVEQLDPPATPVAIAPVVEALPEEVKTPVASDPAPEPDPAPAAEEKAEDKPEDDEPRVSRRSRGNK